MSRSLDPLRRTMRRTFGIGDLRTLAIMPTGRKVALLPAAELRAIVATNAFGLGIEPARCTLLFDDGDRRTQLFFLGGRHPRLQVVLAMLKERGLVRKQRASRWRVIRPDAGPPELEAAARAFAERPRATGSGSMPDFAGG